jgi:hypothetical protein
MKTLTHRIAPAALPLAALLVLSACADEASARPSQPVAVNTAAHARCGDTANPCRLEALKVVAEPAS